MSATDAEPSKAAISGFAVAPSPASTVPPVTPTSTATSAVHVPTPTTVPPAGRARRAPNAASPSTAGGQRDFGPRRPGNVSLPYNAGQSVWSATSNGIAMTLRMDPTHPVAGAPVHFVLEGAPPPGLPCCFFQLSPGDAPGFSGQTSKTDPAGCAGPTTGSQRMETNVVFNHGGRVEFLFQVSSLCVNPETAGVVYGSFDVGSGRATAQGPALPKLHADDGRTGAQATDPTLAVAWAEATDTDGYIAGFSVDWGDGTPAQTFAGDPLGCIPTESGWPRSSWTLISGSSRLPPPSHRYAVAHPYMVTVAVWSTGCDGSEVQRVSSFFPWIPPMP